MVLGHSWRLITEMKNWRPIRRIVKFAFLCAAAALTGSIHQLQAAPLETGIFQARAQHNGLDVLTYNVHGLPWPVARDRSPELEAIGLKLRQMHQDGNAPDIVVIQEAFTQDARNIGAIAGYKYTAFGPDSDSHVEMPAPRGSAFRQLNKNESWWKGEGIGKYVGSGLMILSDYPLTNIREMTYSAPACAGFDCLAAKGAMISEVTLPGARHVEIATTHMNSRHASGVSNARATLAWLIQNQELKDFISTRRNHSLPMILGGDFNIGHSMPRQHGMWKLMTALGSKTCDGLRKLRDEGQKLSVDAAYELQRGRDWELSLSGQTDDLTPGSVEVPFGSENGSPLSDHLGYTIHFTLGREWDGVPRGGVAGG